MTKKTRRMKDPRDGGRFRLKQKVGAAKQISAPMRKSEHFAPPR
jgi:hypothetical protein